MGRNLCTIRGRNATKGFVRVELISNKFFRKPLLYQAQLLPGVYSRVSLGPNVLVVPFKSVSKNRIEQGIFTTFWQSTWETCAVLTALVVNF